MDKVWNGFLSELFEMIVYLTHYLAAVEPYNQSPRLFQLSSVSGTFEAVEIQNPSRNHDFCTTMPFLQSDLYKASQPGIYHNI